jgi:hypothetical protein
MREMQKINAKLKQTLLVQSEDCFEQFVRSHAGELYVQENAPRGAFQRKFVIMFCKGSNSEKELTNTHESLLLFH